MADVGKYIDYLNDHILKVREAWNIMKSREDFPYCSDECFLSLMEVVIETHDFSKFSYKELLPYAKHFYPQKGDKKVEGEFEKAWSHHCRMNPHHWQFWVRPGGVMVTNQYLRNLYLCEEVCDWMAMGFVMGDTASSYYKKIKDKIELDPNSRVFIELLLRVVEPEEWGNAQ